MPGVIMTECYDFLQDKLFKHLKKNQLFTHLKTKIQLCFFRCVSKSNLTFEMFLRLQPFFVLYALPILETL